MKRYRRAADYEILDPFDQTTAVNQVEQSKRLVDKVNSFEQENRTKAA